MRFKIVEQQPRTYVIVLRTGEELASGLKQFASDQKLSSSTFKAIGAFSSVKLGWFDWDSKQYRLSVTLNEQVELVSLIGDVALADGRPQVHSHVVIAKQDGTAHGGHLVEAYVRPTCEIVLAENPEKLRKELDPELGLAPIVP